MGAGGFKAFKRGETVGDWWRGWRPSFKCSWRGAFDGGGAGGAGRRRRGAGGRRPAQLGEKGQAAQGWGWPRHAGPTGSGWERGRGEEAGAGGPLGRKWGDGPGELIWASGEKRKGGRGWGGPAVVWVDRFCFFFFFFSNPFQTNFKPF
jgi:hypothetical protein